MAGFTLSERGRHDSRRSWTAVAGGRRGVRSRGRRSRASRDLLHTDESPWPAIASLRPTSGSATASTTRAAASRGDARGGAVEPVLAAPLVLELQLSRPSGDFDSVTTLLSDFLSLRAAPPSGRSGETSPYEREIMACIRLARPPARHPRVARHRLRLHRPGPLRPHAAAPAHPGALPAVAAAAPADGGPHRTPAGGAGAGPRRLHQRADRSPARPRGRDGAHPPQARLRQAGRRQPDRGSDGGLRRAEPRLESRVPRRPPERVTAARRSAARPPAAGVPADRGRLRLMAATGRGSTPVAVATRLAAENTPRLVTNRMFSTHAVCDQSTAHFPVPVPVPVARGREAARSPAYLAPARHSAATYGPQAASGISSSAPGASHLDHRRTSVVSTPRTSSAAVAAHPLLDVGGGAGERVARGSGSRRR